jgi:hypothetical protein
MQARHGLQVGDKQHVRHLDVERDLRADAEDPEAVLCPHAVRDEQGSPSCGARPLDALAPDPLEALVPLPLPLLAPPPALAR